MNGLETKFLGMPSGFCTVCRIRVLASDTTGSRRIIAHHEFGQDDGCRIMERCPNICKGSRIAPITLPEAELETAANLLAEEIFKALKVAHINELVAHLPETTHVSDQENLVNIVPLFLGWWLGKTNRRNE